MPGVLRIRSGICVPPKDGKVDDAHDLFKQYGKVSLDLFELLDGLATQTAKDFYK